MTAFLKWIMILINIMAVLALVLVKIGSLVSPDTLLLPAYTSLALLPFIIINIGFVLFWSILRKWTFLLSLLALLIFSSTVKSIFPINFHKGKIDTNRQKISILTYNTMNTGNLKEHREDDPNPVVKYILDSQADIVCLQEMAVSENTHQLQEKDFNRIFKSYPFKFVTYKLNRWNMHVGMAVLSKYPIINKKRINYDSAFNLSVYSDIAIGKDTIRLINNHLESNRITSQDMQRTSKLKDDFDSGELGSVTKYLSSKLSVAYKKRAMQVDLIAEIMKKSPYKLIVCGDFNDVPASYAYTTLKGNLKDAFKETGNGLGWTFHQSFYRFRIDYIMYDKAFQSANYKTGHLDASDHYPIQTDLYLSKY